MWQFKGVVVLALLAAASGLRSAPRGDNAKVAERNDEFLAWFVSKGGTAHGVTVGQSEWGRGVFVLPGGADGAIPKEGDKVLSVPLSWCMCRDTALHDPAPNAKQAYRRIDDDDDLVSLMLLREMSKGSSKIHVKRAVGSGGREGKDYSAWAPYLRVLPRTVPLTVFYSKDELAALQDPALARQAKSRRASLKRRYRTLAPVVRLLFKDIKASQRRTRFADYLWAKSVIGSRALSMHGAKYLVPFADMFNYEAHAEEREADNGNAFLKYHKVEGGFFSVYADRDGAAGRQLMEDYGDNSNELYINHHGMVVDKNPFDCVNVQLPPIDRASVPARGRVSDRLRLGRVGGSGAPQCMRPKQPLRKMVEAYLLVAVATRSDLEACEAAFARAEADTKSSRNAGPIACLESFGPAVHKAAVRFLSDALKAQLDAYPTSLADDLVLLAMEEKRQKRKDSSEKSKSAGNKKNDLAAQLAAFSKEGLTDREILAIRYRVTRKRLLALLLVDQAAKLGLSDGAGSNDALDTSAAAGARALAAASAAQARASSDWSAVPEDGPLEDKVAAFNAWFASFSPRTNKLVAATVPGMRVGTLTTEKVSTDEIYLEVPLASIMNKDSGWRDNVLGPVYRKLAERHPRGDAFHELLFHLIYERFVRGRESKYWPYLNVIPSKEELNAPGITWTKEELDELEGSDILPNLRDYSRRVDRKFKGVKKHVLSQFPDVFVDEHYSLENYRWAHAILDSRRIWWGGEGHLVPMLDLVNCAEGPDPSRVHSTWLDAETKSYAVTKGAWDFKKGEQLFEPYGQPNHIYFAYHGFVLDHNAHDCVKMDLTLDENVDEYTRKKKELRRVLRSTNFCVSPRKITQGLLEFMRIAHDASTRDDQRQALRKECLRRLSRYPTTAAEDEAMLAEAGAWDKLGYKKATAVKMRLSEKRILDAVVKSIGSAKGEL